MYIYVKLKKLMIYALLYAIDKINAFNKNKKIKNKYSFFLFY